MKYIPGKLRLVHKREVKREAFVEREIYVRDQKLIPQ